MVDRKVIKIPSPTRQVVTLRSPTRRTVNLRAPERVVLEPTGLEFGEGAPAPDPVFDPTSIASLAHRWRATEGTWTGLDGTGAASSGDPVGTWTDEIGGVDLVAPSTAARPSLATVGSTRVVSFDGTDDTLISGLDALAIPTGWSTIWGVVTYPTAIGRPWDRVTTGNVDRMMVTKFGGDSLQYYVSGRILTVPVEQASGDWMIPCATVDLTDVHVYLDGYQIGEADEAVGSGITDLRLGSSNADSSFYDGHVLLRQAHPRTDSFSPVLCLCDLR